MRLTTILALAALSSSVAARAGAQAPVAISPVPTGPVMGPPVVVMPGQHVVLAPPPPPTTIMIDGVPMPLCPAEVPCPPPCPPAVPCPPPPCVCTSAGAPSTVVVAAGAMGAESVVVTEPAAAPADPAPGTFAAGYLGTFDGTDVVHGGALRFTGHLADVWFLELVLGGQGASTPLRDIGEGILLVGPRVAAPLSAPHLRIYASLDTGILIRSIGNRQTWGIWPIQLGGGLEFGGELDALWAFGGYVDVRAEARVPFEREPASFGVVWSAGLALLWF